MTRRVYVLRHAKTAPAEPGAPDAERPLTRQGHDDATDLGRWLLAHDMVPRRIVASSAVRARQTAEALAKAAGLDEAAVTVEPRVYDADVRTLLDVVGRQDPQAPWMLVGHNPGCEDLLEALCTTVAPGSDGRLLPSGTLAILRAPEGDVRGSTCTVERIVRPQDVG
jgi:phosphohistidine phosphatase